MIDAQLQISFPKSILPCAERTHDRRASNRLPIECDVYYKVLGGKKTVKHVGSGKSINMSSGGVLFTTETGLLEGERIELAVSWPVAGMRSRHSPCLREPSIEWSRAGGERPARWDVAMDRRRRGELFVPVFAPALRILSDRRPDRQRAAPRSSIQFDRSCRFRQQASPWVWAVSGWSCPRPRQY